MTRRNTVPPAPVRSMRPAISGISGPPVAILPARRGGAPPPKRASTRDNDRIRAPPPPSISARGTITLVTPSPRRTARSPENELPRACRPSAPANFCASGASSVPSPVRASWWSRAQGRDPGADHCLRHRCADHPRKSSLARSEPPGHSARSPAASPPPSARCVAFVEQAVLPVAAQGQIRPFAP